MNALVSPAGNLVFATRHIQAPCCTRSAQPERTLNVTPGLGILGAPTLIPSAQQERALNDTHDHS